MTILPLHDARPFLRSAAPRAWLALCLVLVALLAGCERPRAPRNPGDTSRRESGAQAAVAPASSPVPVEKDDATWGDANAPVTVVAFLDLECPFCARAEPILTELENRHGPSKLRVVWKHFPLPFHRHAEGAARAARAAFELGGNRAFFAFVSALYAEQQALGDAAYARAATTAGLRPEDVTARAATPGTITRVHQDVGLAQALGVQGTPQFFVNGSRIEGLVPVEFLDAYVERELEAAAFLAARGTPPAEIYARRSTENYEPPKPEPAETAEEPEVDTTAWPVPVGSSPEEGPADALVTIVEFSDYQCPFCKRVQSTLASLRERYGKDLRIVWKHAPLPFHEHAKPAALLAAEAHAERGDAGFWKATELLFGASPDLDDETLRNIGRKLGLDAKKVEKALHGGTRDEELRADQDVAQRFGVTGTPHFFINGRRLIGAQPLEAFTALIDTELEAARALVEKQGVPRAGVYEQRTKTAAHPPP